MIYSKTSINKSKNKNNVLVTNQKSINYMPQTK